MVHFAEFLSEHREIVRMTDIKRHHIETYKSWRIVQINRGGRPGTVHRNTINLELDTLRAMFNFAASFHDLRSNPVKNIERFKVVKERPRVLTEEEVAKVHGNSRGMYRIVFLTALYTGMRKGELENLVWDNTDFATRLIHIRPVGSWIPKTWEVRDLPMHPHVYDALKNLPHRSKWVFTAKSGKPIMHLRRAFLRVCARLGINEVTFHTLRHTFASHLLTKKGVDIVTVSKLLGHKDIETTMIYLHTDLETMRLGVGKLDFPTEKVIGTNLAQTKTPEVVSPGTSTKRKEMVPKGGLEPPRVAPYAPQTYVSTSSTTSAHSEGLALSKCATSSSIAA